MKRGCPSGPRLGGARQRRAAATRAAARQEPIKSTLVDFLLTQWAWGLMSATTLQQIAMHATLDIDSLLVGLQCDKCLDQLEALANLGTDGNHSHCARDLKDTIAMFAYRSATSMIMVPLADPSGSRAAFQSLQSMCILLVKDILYFCYVLLLIIFPC